MAAWSVYLLECADHSLYCGVTTDLEARLQKHNQGTASRYTRARRPVALAAVRENLEKSAAFKLEYRIKQLPAARKIAALNSQEIGADISAS
jgi:putative endonuclease